MSGVRVVGIVGSPRKCGDRELLMRRALEIIAAEGLPAQLIPLAGKSIGPCPRAWRTTEVHIWVEPL